MRPKFFEGCSEDRGRHYEIGRKGEREGGGGHVHQGGQGRQGGQGGQGRSWKVVERVGERRWIR